VPEDPDILGHSFTWVSEEGGTEESPGSEDLSLLSYTLRYVSLVDLTRLWVARGTGTPEDCLLCIDKARAKDNTYI